MNAESRQKKLEDIKLENHIWIIYIGIILLSWYANKKEKEYLLYNDEKSKRQYQLLLILIFSILVIIYYIFVKSSYEDYKSLIKGASKKAKTLNFYSYIASLLVLISGVIFLTIALLDENIDVELAFN